jgi:hypothetical protein
MAMSAQQQWSTQPDAAAAMWRLEEDRQAQLLVVRDFLTQLPPSHLVALASLTVQFAPLYRSVWACVADLPPAALIDAFMEAAAADNRLLWFTITNSMFTGVRIGHFADDANHLCAGRTNEDGLVRIHRFDAFLRHMHPKFPTAMAEAAFDVIRDLLERDKVLLCTPHHRTSPIAEQLYGACVRSQCALATVELFARNNLRYDGIPPAEAAAFYANVLYSFRGCCLLCRRPLAAAAAAAGQQQA